MTELDFPALLHAIAPDIAEPVPEFRFCQRKWRFDYAWPERRVAVECSGGYWAPHGGRHNTDADRLKLAEAAARHWLVLQFSNAMLRDDPVHCIALLRLALG